MNSGFQEKLTKKTIKYSKIFARTPFVRAVILNGSLAQGEATKSSDIDLLIITKKGRIFTARFFVNLIGILSGQKRSKDDCKSHAGKFCFNYFMTEDFLTIPSGRGEKIDRYCADNYSKSVLIWGDKKIFMDFFEVNRELFDKYPTYTSPNLGEENGAHFSPPGVGGARGGMKGSSPKAEPVLNSIQEEVRWGMNLPQVFFEFLLSGSFGDWLEQKLKNYQIKKIESDPRTLKYPDLIVYNDQELRFHPPKNSS